jgi:type III secretion protein J
MMSSDICEALVRTSPITFRLGLRALLTLRTPRLAAITLCALTLAACKVDLYTNLDQQPANEMVAALQRSGIPAERIIGKGGRFAIAVDDSRFADAVRTLSDNGLPKQEFATLGDVFKKDGLVSSPVQERAQMIFALGQELSRTVSGIDGVLSARVHIVLPENDPLRQQLVPSSASVFIRHRSSVPMGGRVPQIKMLVANGIAGLSYDKVSVILIPVDAPLRNETADVQLVSFLGMSLHSESLSRAVLLFCSLLAMNLALISALGFTLWRRRQRVYALRPVSSVGLS